MIGLFLPERAAVKETLGHPAAGIIGWVDPQTNESGVPVTEDTALNFSAVWCATRIIAETVASLPLLIYERTDDDGKLRARQHPLWPLLHDAPNGEMSAYTFLETVTAHVVNWGNGYAEIQRNGRGDVLALLPIAPDKVRVMRADSGAIEYHVLDERYTVEAILSAEDVLHVKGLGFNGLKGMSVIRHANQSIGLGLATERHGATFFGNGARPGGVLQHPGTLSAEARANIRKEWREKHGSSNPNDVAILWEGMGYTPLNVPHDEAQFLETRKFQINEIARWYRLPPHMLAELDRATHSNIEQQSLEFVIYSLTPWLRRWESEIDRQLFPQREQADFFAQFLLEGLLRGDIQSRYNAYAVGRQWGWLSVDDIRRLENLNPIEGGDVYLQPLNMVPAGQEPESEDMPETGRNLAKVMEQVLASGRRLRKALAEGPQAVRQIEEQHAREMADLRQERQDILAEIERRARQETVAPQWDAVAANVRSAADAMFRAALERMLRIEGSQARGAARRQVERGASFLGWSGRFYGEHRLRVAEAIRPAVQAWVAVDGLQDAQELVSVLAGRHCDLSEQELLSAADGPREGFCGRVAQLTDSWLESRISGIEELRDGKSG